MPEELQGKGFSKKVLGIFCKQYEKANVHTIRLYANIDIGGYAWGKYGFSAERGEVLNIIRTCKDAAKKESASSIVDEYYSTNDNSARFPMNLLADPKWGGELLLDTGWEGEINLDDEAAMARFKKYTETN